MAAFGDDWGTDINNMQAGIFFSGAPSGRSRGFASRGIHHPFNAIFLSAKSQCALNIKFSLLQKKIP
jgi:hypothetical protein